MIGRGPRCHLGESVADVLLQSRAELLEGSEKVIVARFLLAMPVAHRPGIHQLVVEDLVLIGATYRRLDLVGLARITGCANQFRSAAVHAESVFRGPVDHAFRIDRARQVDMQVAALGHLPQKCLQQPRLMPHRFKILRRFLLRALRSGDLRHAKNGQETTDCRETQASHHKKASNHETCIVEDFPSSKKTPVETRLAASPSVPKPPYRFSLLSEN